MAALNQEYRKYLNDNFPGQEIKAPLFFKGNLGLRFDLQKGETGEEEYFVEVSKRSTSLFEAAFDPNDNVFLVFRDYKWKRRKIRFANYCFKQIDDLKKNEVDYSVVRNLYENKKDDIYNVAVLKIKANRINYKNILTAIANTDFPPRIPRFKFLSSVEVYFINTTQNLIFHMYDDRGLDIVSSDAKILKSIYTKYSEWILDANREPIDKVMAVL
jgi:Domain of unknown function (DUF3885)